MRFNTHWQVDGKHAFLGASKYHWINYDLEKMKRIWENKFASERGTRIHRIAAELIRERIRLEPIEKTLNMYVNDSIGFRMTPEQVLLFSENCFGTPDAIDFRKGILRVHDLKTGMHPGSFHQPEIYCALFCLEYGVNPYDIEMIMRIYQSDTVFEEIADASWIKDIMDKIRMFDKEIEEMKAVVL